MTYKLIMVESKTGEAIELGGAVGDVTTIRMLQIFGMCINLQRRKALSYGEAYRSQGYMGNLARVLSKVARLKNMVWTDVQRDDADESVEDTILDLINIAAFFWINREDNNKWG